MMRPNVEAVPLLFGVLLAGAVLVAGCGASDRGPYEQVRLWATVIRQGQGYKRPRGSEKDFFTLHMDALEHPFQGVRVAVASDLHSNTIMSAKYPVLPDAYIDYGPVDKLRVALLRAWRGAELNSRERYSMAEAFLDLETRQYLWDHPDVAREAGLRRERPPQKGWSISGPELLADRLLAEGDEEFKTVWDDYKHHEKLLLAGKLKPVEWKFKEQPNERPPPGR